MPALDASPSAIVMAYIAIYILIGFLEVLISLFRADAPEEVRILSYVFIGLMILIIKGALTKK